MTSATLNQDRIGFSIEIGKRHYPVSRFPETAETPFDEQATDETTRLRRELANYFWSHIPFSRIVEETGYRTKDHLAKTVTASVNQLVRWRNEFLAFAEMTCETSIELRVEGAKLESAVQKAHESQRQELVALLRKHRIKPPGLRPEPFADLLLHPADQCYTLLHKKLRRACQALAGDMFRILDTFVDGSVVGLVQHGADPSTCKLHFFRRVIIHQLHRNKREARRVSRETEFGTIEQNAIVDIAYGQNEFRLARHQHHVGNVVQNEIGNAQFPIPQKYAALIDAIPTWLKRHTRILEGSMFLEQVVEENLQTTVIEEIQNIQYTCEPGIIIGHYVLAGWGEREIDQERERVRIASQKTHDSKRFRSSIAVGAGAACLVALAIGLLFASPANPPRFLPPMLFAALLGVGLAYFALEQYSQVKLQQSDSWFAVRSTIAVASGTLTLLMLGCAFLYLSLPMAITGGLMLLVFFAAWSIAIKSQEQQPI